MARVDMKDQFPTVKRASGAFGRGIRWFIRRTWKPALTLFAILAVAHGIATVILGRRFEAGVAAIKAKGEPVTVAELGGAPVPDEQNRAVVYARIFKILDAKSATKPTEALDDMREPENKSSDNYLQAQATPDQWADAKRAMGYFKDVIPMTEEAMLRPKCRFPVKWKDGFAALFPHLAKLRNLTRVLCAQALLQARDGRMDEAYHTISLAFTVADDAKNDPIVISTLVSVANTRIVDASLRGVLKYGAPSEAVAKQMYDLLGRTDFRPALVTAMKGERTSWFWVFERIRGGGVSEVTALCSGDANDSALPDISFLAKPIMYVWKPFLYADGIYYLKCASKSIEASAKPYRLHAWRQVEDDIKNAPRYALITRTMFPAFSRVSALVDRVHAKTALTQVLLAAQVYKGRTGSYPESLRALRAKVGWQLSMDPFSGRDLVYKRTDKGFQVYSIGENLKDDGGLISKHPNNASETEGDLVLNWDR